jgi:hypothetical protein
MKTHGRTWTLGSLGSITVAALASGCSSSSPPIGTSASSIGSSAFFPESTPITCIAGMCLDDQDDGTGDGNPIQLYCPLSGMGENPRL